MSFAFLVQALIPPDSKSNYDLHLEYSVRDLKSYKQNMTVDVVYIYPADHIPTLSQIEMKIDPRRIKDDLASKYANLLKLQSVGFCVEI